jgi:hypothetical protein
VISDRRKVAAVSCLLTYHLSLENEATASGSGSALPTKGEKGKQTKIYQAQKLKNRIELRMSQIIKTTNFDSTGKTVAVFDDITFSKITPEKIAEMKNH